jgi:hypothetical protein
MPCTYKALNFACNGRGYLTLGLMEETPYPCPTCNTSAYLEKCHRAARDRPTGGEACMCCGPGLTYDAIWATAVKTARECNRDVADETIKRLSATHRREAVFRAD